MKKIILIIICLIICGCSNKEEKIEEKKVSSSGELICVYKENRVNENTIYTSYYLFDFSNQGILNKVTNNEEILFEDTDSAIKDKYKEALESTIKEYEDIKGINVTKKIEDKVISFNVDVNPKEISDDIKEDYYVNLDRISLYKQFTNKGYTCE